MLAKADAAGVDVPRASPAIDGDAGPQAVGADEITGAEGLDVGVDDGDFVAGG